VDLVHTVYEPAGEGPHPTLFCLHGWGANAFDLLTLAPHLCGGRFLVICPQGSVETPIAPGLTGYGWFPLVLGRTPDPGEIHAAVARLWRFVEACRTRYPIDQKRVGVIGFSQGGVMAYALALGRPERFGVLAALSTWLPRELAAAFVASPDGGGPATLVQHGSEDQLIEVDRARDSVTLLRELKIPVTYREYGMGHEITAQSLRDLSGWLQEKMLTPLIVPG
jgi:phospholipase/carboxylesterase